MNHIESCQAIIKNVEINPVLLSTDETHFHLTGRLGNRIFGTDRK